MYFPKELDFLSKLSSQHITLKLLITLKIILLKCVHETFISLIPCQICHDIVREVEYQNDLYFSTVIEPTITYIYPNEY